MIDRNKYDLIIGIDPGVNTGFAVWSTKEKSFMIIMCSKRCVIEQILLTIKESVFVRYEDARLRKWFGKADRERLQGAGSIKRDSQLWEEWLLHHNILFEKVAPKEIKTKMGADPFNRLTKWEGKTNEHARDAAMLVFRL